MAKILVVEDEPSIALGLKSDLQFEGHEVEVVVDGEVAVRRAEEASFDLIVLDLMLPRKDGLTVCRELRRAGNRIPIIMLTAKAQEAEKVLGLEVGADDYVTKPFSPVELRARVKAMLRRTLADDTGILRFGDVEVNFARSEVRRSGELLEITPIELKLLEVFGRHRGRTLTRERLLDQVYGTASCPTDRVIDNHIMHLRRKVEPTPQAPRYVMSVRGIGYRFDG